MRTLFWVVVAIIAALCSLFAISNRQPVTLGLWPLPYLAGLPVYLLVFIALLVGFGIGVIAAWIAGHRRRRELRECRRRAEALERELAATQARLPPPSQSLPAHG